MENKSLRQRYLKRSKKAYNQKRISATTESTNYVINKVCDCLLLIFLGLFGILVYAYVNSSIRAVVVTGVPERVELSGVFEPNSILANGRRLHEDKGFKITECIAFDEQGNLYTGIEDGRILKIKKDDKGRIDEGQVVEIKLQKFKQKVEHERPLGIRYFEGFLYVADTYVGVYKLNLETGDRILFVDSRELDPPALFIDDLAISRDGKSIYFSDASYKYDYENFTLGMFEGGCFGRIFHYDVSKDIVQLIKSNLCFVNGMQLSPDDKKLFYTETYRFRVGIIDLATHEVDRYITLPGATDNIRLSNDGGYWVAIPRMREGLFNSLNNLPFFRQLFVGLFGERGVKLLVSYTPGLVVKLDSYGNPVKLYSDFEGKVATAVTHVEQDVEGNLFLASVKNGFFVKIDKEFL